MQAPVPGRRSHLMSWARRVAEGVLSGCGQLALGRYWFAIVVNMRIYTNIANQYLPVCRQTVAIDGRVGSQRMLRLGKR